MSEADNQNKGQEPAANAPQENQQQNQSPDPWEKFPAEFNWVRKELEDARKEAAEKRVLARDYQEKLANAKTPEEVQQIVAANDKKTADLETQLARERVARKTGLDEDLVEFLTANTEEDLMKQAAKLAGRKKADEDDTVVVTQLGPRGGANPSTEPNELDGHAEWERYKKNRH
jgi:hypothetical protein